MLKFIDADLDVLDDEDGEIKPQLSFFTIAKNVPSRFVKIAKKLDDKNNYTKTCFGVEVASDGDEYSIIIDEAGNSLYYMTSDGHQHYFNYKLSDKEKDAVIALCKKEYKEYKTMKRS